MIAPTGRLVACSRMYDVTQNVADAWTEIFSWAAHRASVALEIVPHAAPAPLETLWARPDMGCVFMCGWPYARAECRPRIIAAPVPAPMRYQGRPVYFTDFVVRANAQFETLVDTFGGTIAVMVDHSHSGYNAVRHHLLHYRTRLRPRLYSATVGPLVTPRQALHAVLNGSADVAPLDSYFHDLIRRHEPVLAAKVRSVGSTDAAPIPPLVASPGAPQASCELLTAALQESHAEAALATCFETLLLERFVRPVPEDYGVTLVRANAAEVAGYPRPA